MSQKAYTVTLTNGDATVTTTGGDFTTAVAATQWLVPVGQGVSFQIQSVTDNNNLELSTPYTGTTGSYSIVVQTSYTTNRNLPKLERGDIETAAIFGRLAETLDTLLGVALTAGGIVFAGSAGALTVDATNFYFDDTENYVRLAGAGTLPSPSSGQAVFGGKTTTGASIRGYGSTYDVTLANRSGTTVLGIGPNSTAAAFAGTLSALGASFTTVAASGTVTISAATAINITNAQGVISFTPGWSGGLPAYFQADVNSGGTGAGDYMMWNVPTGKSFSLAVNNVSVFQVGSTGNAALGLTPANNGTGGLTFELGTTGNGITASTGSADYIRIHGNLYYNIGYKFAGTGYATSYEQNAGVHNWYTSSASGTAGNAATLNTSMTLSTAGVLTVLNDIVGGDDLKLTRNDGTDPAIYTTGTNRGIRYIASGSGVHTFTGPASFSSSIGLAQIAPTQISGNQNDYAPTSIGATVNIRLTSDAARDITGIVSAGTGTNLVIINAGSFTITLKHESGSSTAANRFSNPGGADYALTAGACCMLIYDNTSFRWRVFGK